MTQFFTLVGLAIVGAFGAADGAPPAAKLGAIERLEGLVANEMGTDRAGNVWAWVRTQESVVLYSPDGTLLASTRVPGASAVDIDHVWGIAGIYDFDRTLRVTSFDGQVKRTLSLRDPAGTVAWVDANRVALGPTGAGYRVGLLALDEGAAVIPLGEAKVIGDEPGAQVLRRMVLELDSKRGRLFSLDSFTGDFAAFSLEGHLVRQGTADSPGPAKFGEWLEKVDQQAKASGDRQRPSFGILEFELDEEGDAWVVERCDTSAQKAHLLRIPTAGAESRYEVATTCCSYNFVLVGRTWLMNSVPPPGGRHCTATGRLP